MKLEKLKKILNDIAQARIAVIGDFCLDAYWFVDESKSELSVETGLMTRPVARQAYSPGGAGNVTNNLAALGVKEIRAFGVIGTDPFGREMVRIMQQSGINTDHLQVQEEEWYTHVYAKPYLGDTESNRIDFGNFNLLSVETADRLIENFRQTIPLVDLIIINQQVMSGIHTPYFRNQLAEVMAIFPDKIFIVDSRNYGDEYPGAWRKMNDDEAARLCGMDSDRLAALTAEEVRKAAELLYKKYEKPLYITRGSRGSMFIDHQGVAELPGLMILSRIDTVGAGDSYLAGVASALAARYPMDVAATIGAYTAGVTVQKLFQCGTATPEEILALGADPDFIYEPELAADLRRAMYHPHTEIEVVRVLDPEAPITHAIFDHDGTISTLREGWELIMTPVMMKAILGKQYNTAGEELFSKVRKRVHEFIDKTTGIQTLVQMQGLIQLIREFGIVAEPDILDEFGYKAIYNEALLDMVRERERKFERGELTLTDVTVKNSVELLHALHIAGVKLYLASGTDQADVEHEASLLGYDALFAGRIFGAVGDVTREAKKEVLDKILDTIGTSGHGRVVTFGDGPVEIRETRKRGGISVGVASNEIKRYGLNIQKRTRLIQAGADLVVSDFTQLSALLKYLNI